MQWGERRRVFAKQRRYVFSFDLCIPDGHEPGSGTVVRASNADTGLGTQYHVFGNEAVAGPENLPRSLPLGTLIFASLKAKLYTSRGSGQLEGRFSLTTSDGSLISSTFSGVVREPPGVCMALIKRNDAESYPTLRAHITPAYETTHTRYRWLSERQFIAFGSVDIGRANQQAPWTSRYTFDVYLILAAPADASMRADALDDGRRPRGIPHV